MNISNETDNHVLGRERVAEALHRPKLLLARSCFVRRPRFMATIMAAVVFLAIAIPVTAAEEPPEDFYASYASALKQHVDARGMVNYRALKAAPADLKAFLGSLARLDRAAFNDWPEKDGIAFWINAYNALTLKAIIDHYPIKASGLSAWTYPKNSIRQIGGVWDKLKFRVMGKDMTLEEIEHQVLRKDYNEPRIHMALVCAAMGCPRLLNQPYVGAKLDAQFDEQTRDLLRHPKKFSIDRRRRTVRLSSIFKWFGEDFTKTYKPRRGFGDHSDSERAVLHFVSKHLDATDARYLEAGDYKVKYLDYDWSLNEQ